jgi:hypothetical protein
MTDRTNNHENGVVNHAATPIKRLVIEWRHLVVDGATCERCGATGSEVRTAVDALTKELGAKGIKVVFKETALGTDQLEESNMVILNGKPLEDLIAGGVTETPCSSCSTLTGTSACCRAVEVDNQQYEEIPAWLIKRAAYRAVGLREG